MISETQQEQASLYALDLLSAADVAAFERELAGDPELQTLVRELQDAAALMALVPAQVSPSADLKARIMQQIAAEPTAAAAPTADKIITPPPGAFQTWIPWAIAAALALFCGLLAVDRASLQKRLSEEQEATPVLVALAATPDAPAQADAVVSWLPAKQSGVIKIRNLPVAATGHDYQLWAVDAAHKDPVSAGVVRVSSDGVAEVHFKPTEPTEAVQAFAISVEREGGVPKKEGPIVLIGKI